MIKSIFSYKNYVPIGFFLAYLYIFFSHYMSASRLVPQVLIILLFYYTDFNMNTSSLSHACHIS